MDILVHAKNFKVSKPLRALIEKQAGRLSKVYTKVKSVSVFLEGVKNSRGLNQDSQVKVGVAIPGRIIYAKSRAQDLYLAVSQAIRDASRALRKKKEKMASAKR